MYVVQVKSKVKISQNFVAFSEYMNFTHKNNAKCITTTDRGVLMETEMLRSYVLPQGSSNATEWGINYEAHRDFG